MLASHVNFFSRLHLHNKTQNSRLRPIALIASKYGTQFSSISKTLVGKLVQNKNKYRYFGGCFILAILAVNSVCAKKSADVKHVVRRFYRYLIC